MTLLTRVFLAIYTLRFFPQPKKISMFEVCGDVVFDQRTQQKYQGCWCRGAPQIKITWHFDAFEMHVCEMANNPINIFILVNVSSSEIAVYF